MLTEFLSFLFVSFPGFLFSLLSKTVSLSLVLTFDYKGIITLLAILIGIIYYLVNRYYLTVYSRLPQPVISSSKATGASYDLHPDVSAFDDTKTLSSNYAEEFLGSFLQSIKVFGYIEQPVFHELARRLQTRKLPAGDFLFTADEPSENSFFIVVEGCVQVFLKMNHYESNLETYLSDSLADPLPGHKLLNEVNAGGTVSSLFSILALLATSYPSSTSSNPIPTPPPPTSPSSTPPPLMNNTLLNTTYTSGRKESFDVSGHPTHPHGQTHLLLPPSILNQESLADINDPEVERFTSFASLPTNQLTQSAPSTFESSHQEKPATSSSLPAHSISSKPSSSFFSLQHSNSHVPELRPRKLEKPPFTRTFTNQSTSSNPFHTSSISTSFFSSSPPLRSSKQQQQQQPSNTTLNAPPLLSSPFDPRPIFPHLDHGFTYSSSATSQLNSEPRSHTTKQVPKPLLYGLAARASQDSTLVVIPAEAFLKLNEKYPNAAAHIAQVILTRFQRVTCMTLSNYLGLPNEVLLLLQWVHDYVTQPLPDLFFLPGGLERLRRRFHLAHSIYRAPRGAPSVQDISTLSGTRRGSDPSSHPYSLSASTTNPNSNPAYNHPTHPTNTLTNSSHGGGSSSGVNNGVSTHGVSSTTTSTNPTTTNATTTSTLVMDFRTYEDDHEETRLRETVLECILQRIGLPPSSLLKPSLDTSTSSTMSFSLDSSDIVIQIFRKGELLSKPSETIQGLYFVVDGLLAMSINHHQFFIRPGGLAGYLAGMTGHKSFTHLEARTDVCVGMLAKSALDRLIDRYPMVMLTLVQRLVSILNPLVLHIDFALEWMQVNAGHVLYRQSEPGDAIYIVLNGRLRSITEEAQGRFHVVAEHGPGASVGEKEVLMHEKRPVTTHAIRDTELTKMPHTLFNALALRHPEITLTMAKLIASRTPSKISHTSTLLDSIHLNLGKNNVNLKTVAILPVAFADMNPVLTFAEKLHQALHLIGVDSQLLNQACVLSVLGKYAFAKMGKLKLMNWLAEQEEKHRIVLYLADGGVNSPWTQRCIRQADCILLVAVADHEPSIGEFERYLLGVKTTARKELVLLHSERGSRHGSTQAWLRNRLWIHGHHHVAFPQVKVHSTQDRIRNLPLRVKALVHLKDQLEKYYDALYKPPPVQSTGIRSDFARLARSLCGKSIGLVLSGGGARGIAHVGIIQAFEEAGIPIDMIGGTSFGAFVGGLYARDATYVSILGRVKAFCSRMSSVWRTLWDLTYPITAYLTGHAFNRGIWKSFGDIHIEDLWLNYFCVTTNIVNSRMELHQSGYLWRYVRASMSLSGFIPPLSDNGNLLVDGGYLNNLPGDIMKALGADLVIMVDVAAEDDTSKIFYGDSLSGFEVLLSRFNPFKKGSGIPTLAEIQSKLAYISCIKQLEEAKQLPGCYYLRPPVAPFGTFEFGKFESIYETGYKYGKEVVKAWEKDGTLEIFLNTKSNKGKPANLIRRNSI